MPFSGFSGYDLMDSRDQLLTLDVNGDGGSDVVTFRPGVGSFWVMKSDRVGDFTIKYQEESASKDKIGTDPYPFIKSFRPIVSSDTRCIAGNFNSDGYQDLFCWHHGGVKSPGYNGQIVFELGGYNSTFTRGWSSSYYKNNLGEYVYDRVGGFPFNRAETQVTVLKNAATWGTNNRSRDAILLWVPGYGYAAYLHFAGNSNAPCSQIRVFGCPF